MAAKDLFSNHSRIYASFRPTYPDDLYNFIYDLLREKNNAWDCGTGNGQVAHALAKNFTSVYATDLSREQIGHAIRAPNIFYSVGPAEKTSFGDSFFDLITVGQALHWFNIDAFYSEVKRTGKPGSVLAVWGYSLPRVSPEIDKLLLRFYHETTGPYWDPARRLVEEEYLNVYFPFDPVPAPGFTINVIWTPEHLAGYITSWSATQKFISKNQFDPVPEFISSLGSLWKAGEAKPVSLPVFMKAGRIN